MAGSNRLGDSAPPATNLRALSTLFLTILVTFGNKNNKTGFKLHIRRGKIEGFGIRYFSLLQDASLSQQKF